MIQDTISNKIIWWNGCIVPWNDAQIHLTSETASRGLNVFEGIRFYWRPIDEMYVGIAVDEHLARLARSAQLLLFPEANYISHFKSGILELLKEIKNPTDLYLRPTIYMEHGAYEIEKSKIILGEYISWRPEPSIQYRTVKCSISTWQHIPTACLPLSAKVGASYTVFRMARLEAMALGNDEAILLNSDGYITETGGGSVFIIKNDKVITPPLETGILPSITRRIVLDYLCPLLKLETEERSFLIDELFNADEAFIAGTLCEISKIISIDTKDFSTSGSLVTELQGLYHKLCTSENPAGFAIVFNPKYL